MSMAPAASLFGTFDVKNYGDLLYPHLARWGLGGAISELRCYSPNGGELQWFDTLPTEAVGRAVTASPPPALCLIGGGNIIDANPTPLADYEARAAYAYSALWIGAAIIAARTGARIAWNAPGVPQPIENGWARRLRNFVLAASDIVTVRDEPSRLFLDLGRTPPGEVVPDTALSVSRLWPLGALTSHAGAAFASRGRKVPKRWVVFHLNSRYLNPSKQAAVVAVGRICAALDAVPVLVAIGPCHGDDALAAELWPALPPGGLLVDRPAGLKEIAALIAHAQGYAGSSLHGLITALSYRRPAIAVARSRVVKFLGFLGPLGLAEHLHESWDDAARAASEQLRPLGEEACAALAAAEARIERHWRTIRELIAQPPAPEKVAARRRLLAALDAVPVPFPQWTGLLNELSGGGVEPSGMPKHPGSEKPDAGTAPPEWVAEADALARLLPNACPAEFERRLAAALARWPTEIRFQLLQCGFLARSGNRGAAERALRALREKRPDNPWPAVRLTQLLAEEGRFPEARELFECELRTAAIPEETKKTLLTALAAGGPINLD